MKNAQILKRVIITGFFFTTSALAFATDVGVSVSVGQPGFYGRIDIGDYPYPAPRVLYERPIIVHRRVDLYEPLYLRVPPGHAKNWARFCGRYDACGRPVYFVRDDWYEREYLPIYHDRHGEGRYESNGRYEDGGRHGGGPGNNGRVRGRGGERG